MIAFMPDDLVERGDERSVTVARWVSSREASRLPALVKVVVIAASFNYLEVVELVPADCWATPTGQRCFDLSLHLVDARTSEAHGHWRFRAFQIGNTLAGLRQRKNSLIAGDNVESVEASNFQVRRMVVDHSGSSIRLVRQAFGRP